MKLQGEERLYQIVIAVLVGSLLLVCAFPLVYVICVSLTSDAEWYERGKMMILPYRPTIQAYIKIFTTNALLLNSLWVSVVRAVVGTCLSMAFTMVVGFGVSRRDMPGGRFLMFFILVTVLFGGGLIPTFLVIKDLGLYDSFWSMIVPGLVNSWNVLVFRQFFMNLPHDIEEAADIDGVTKVGLFVRIVLPMSLAVIASLGLFTAVGHWNSWFDAMVYIKSEALKPLQLMRYIIRTIFASDSTICGKPSSPFS